MPVSLTLDTRCDNYAVMGNPIAHSKSPRIHAAFAEQTRQPIVYQALLVEIGEFAQAAGSFRRAGGKGLNVTVPFKRDAWEFADARSARAELAGAANTLSFADDGSCRAENTDGTGLVRDLTANHGVRLRGARILLLGAGGAARGVIGPLLDEHPAALVIANRTPERAAALSREFSRLGDLSGCGFAELQGERFDLIINATSASLQGEVPPLPGYLLKAGACCYDMMYGARPTAFLRWAAEQGARQTVDGLGMLVEQAAESFFIWRGVRPETAPVIAVLRREMTDTPPPPSGP